MATICDFLQWYNNKDVVPTLDAMQKMVENILCKSMIDIDSSQLYLYSTRQDMPTVMYTKWDYNKETQNFKARQNRVQTFENMVKSSFRATRPECKIENYYTKGLQKKIYCFSVDGYCNHCSTVFEAMGCYFHFCPFNQARPSITDMKSNEERRKEQRMSFKKVTFEKKDTL